MIKSDRQYWITKNQVDRFSRTLANFRRQPAEAKAQEDALQSSWRTLRSSCKNTKP